MGFSLRLPFRKGFFHMNMMKSNKASVRKKRRMLRQKRSLDPAIQFDYKDTQTLRRFVTEHGKIVPRRISGASAQQQRSLTIAVKRARIMGLLPIGQALDTRKPTDFRR